MIFFYISNSFKYYGYAIVKFNFNETTSYKPIFASANNLILLILDEIRNSVHMIL